MKGFVAACLSVGITLTTLCAAPAPDFEAAHKEVMEILSGFIKVDTVNPPGNETRGAEFLKGYLDKAGIASEILELEPRRGNLVARIKGNGKKKPLLLMGHLDVVGVEREKWSVDPFAAVIKDGFIYGRGAADDKGMTSVCLEVMLMLQRMKVPLDRDVIFLAEAGEESATTVGIDFMVEKHWDKLACEFALNEGGVIRDEGGKIRYVGVSTTEKVPRPVLLSAKGTSGHGSKPRMDNAIVHLAAAVAKVGQWQAPMRLNETTREFFARLAAISPPEEAALYRNLENPAMTARVQETLRASNITYNAMLRTTISPNMIKGGFRVNVIPGDALATVDVRTLPDEDFEKFLQTLRDLINDPAVEVVSGSSKARPMSPPSRLDTEMFRALERVQQRMFPGAQTLPVMLAGATDSAQLRAKGVQVYGIGSVMTEEESNRFHGNDERLSVAGLRTFLEYVWHAVNEVAASK